ncbi:MAG: hypothetical protein KDC54_11770, partial [Lewinella sp.]|nr:hypothetical protein [Lewinella sp.]
MTSFSFAFPRVIAVLTVVFLFNACTPDQGGRRQTTANTASDRVITIYHNSYLVPDQPIYDNFEKNTEYHVNVIPMPGREIVAKAKAGELAGGDFVVLEDLYQAHQLIQAGVVEPYNVGN